MNADPTGWDEPLPVPAAGARAVAGQVGAAELAIVLDALGSAAEYRRYRASLTCEACDSHPDEQCGDHAADLSRAAEYDALAARLAALGWDEPLPAAEGSRGGGS